MSRAARATIKVAPRRDSSSACISSTITICALLSSSRERSSVSAYTSFGVVRDGRRRAQHRSASLRRIPAAHRCRHLHRRIAGVFREAADFAARLGEILVDVRRERFQWRHIDDAHFVGQPAALEPFAQQLVDRGQKRCERLAGAGRSSDQRMGPVANRAPAFGLRLGGRQHAATVASRFGKAGFPPAGVLDGSRMHMESILEVISKWVRRIIHMQPRCTKPRSFRVKFVSSHQRRKLCSMRTVAQLSADADTCAISASE